MAKRSPDPIFVLRGSKHPVSCVKFAQNPSSDGNHILLTGGTNGQVNIWDLSTRRLRSSLDGHHGQGILTLEELAKGQILTHGRDGHVHMWDLGEGRSDIMDSFASSTNNFCQCALWQCTGAGYLAVSGGQMSEVSVISLKDHQVIAKLVPADGHIPLGMAMCMKFADESRLLIGYEDGSIALWDTSSCRMLSESRLHQEPVMCLEFCSASSSGISGSSTSQLVAWNITTQGEICLKKEMTLTNPGVAAISLRSDGKILASGGWDSRIRLWSWKKLKPLAVLDYHSETVNSLDFSSFVEGKPQLMAAGSKDTLISVWSLYNDVRT